MDEYLTVEEVAALLKKKPTTILKMMARGPFIEGVHFFRPPKMRPLFKKSRLIELIEGGSPPAGNGQKTPMIRMRRGYNLGDGL